MGFLKGDSMKPTVLMLLSLAFVFSGESARGEIHRKAFNLTSEA